MLNMASKMFEARYLSHFVTTFNIFSYGIYVFNDILAISGLLSHCRFELPVPALRLAGTSVTPASNTSRIWEETVAGHAYNACKCTLLPSDTVLPWSVCRFVSGCKIDYMYIQYIISIRSPCEFQQSPSVPHSIEVLFQYKGTFWKSL